MADLRFAAVLLGAVLAVGCASSGAVPKPFPGATTAGVPTPEASPGIAEPSPALEAGPLALSTALELRGVPYRNGGSDPSGFDCSGLVQWVFAQNGRALPREVREQYRFGREVDTDDVRPGDLLFFDTSSHGASHVGIALDHETFVHAPSSNGVVRVERYTSAYWSRRYVGARRVE
jgi:cell wall-associated NlpC family hydrolase